MKGRKFSDRATHHIYQRCKDHGVLFYTTEDRIVYYTLAAVKARKHGITVNAASLMFTHIHQSLTARSQETLHWYLHDTDSSYSRLYNSHYGRTGRLFERFPGHAQKFTSKDIRSNFIYVFNNHVEQGLCSRAVENRWSFLAYAASKNPFSKPIDRLKASKPLRKALKLVDRRIARLKALEYCDLNRIFAVLTAQEREQFIDYVISEYALVDFTAAIAHFGSLEALILAADSTTGGEFEIKEDYSKLKDTGYEMLIQEAEKSGFLESIFSMSSQEKMDRILYFLRMRSVHPDHLRRFFHYDFHIERR